MRNKKRLLCIILAAVMVFGGALPACAVTGYSVEESDARLASLAPPALPGGADSPLPGDDPYIPPAWPDDGPPAQDSPEQDPPGVGDEDGGAQTLDALDAGPGVMAAALAAPVLTWDPGTPGLLRWNYDPQAYDYTLNILSSNGKIGKTLFVTPPELRAVNIREAIRINGGAQGEYRVNVQARDAAGVGGPIETATYTYNPNAATAPGTLPAPSGLVLSADGKARWDLLSSITYPNVGDYQLVIHGTGTGYTSKAILLPPTQREFDVRDYLYQDSNAATDEYYVVVRARDNASPVNIGEAATSWPFHHVVIPPPTPEPFPLFPPASVDLDNRTGEVSWPAIFLGADGYVVTVHNYTTKARVDPSVSLSKEELSWDGLVNHLKASNAPTGYYYVIVRTRAADGTLSLDGTVSGDAYYYTATSTPPGPGGSYNNVYPAGNAPSSPVAPYAIVGSPGGYRYEDLRFEQKTLANSADFSAMIGAHHDAAISSFITGNNSWATSALWWDLYMTNNGTPISLPGPFTVYIPVATGINQASYDYILLHDTGGSVERLSFTPMAGGVTFTVRSLSPFALLWKPKATGGTTDPGTTDPGTTDPANPGDPNNPDDWGGPGDIGYDAFWDDVEDYIRAARRGEYIDVVLPYYVDSVPDSVLERLADSRATLVIESTRRDRRYRLYGPDLVESRLRQRTYRLSELYGLLTDRDRIDWDKVYYDKDFRGDKERYDSGGSYDPGPSTGGDGGYRPISSSGYTGNNYNPGTGGGIRLFSNSRIDDPLPELPVLPALGAVDEPMSGSNRIALGCLIAFFALAAVLPLVEKGVSEKRERLAAEKARKKPASSRLSQLRPAANRPKTAR